ncbi:Glycosyltransferase involved in cell wall bisynthesis [Salinimicrobium catena]|uniref:Glycosyltransferase involved in cell wall bisynthesis n=1 Tax=Salinimicrobium catena TaxID=390640 RepID=A0A1H5LKU2_9FLAO|nr:glycosyltransferase [Salinimicrobium catena]SDL11163.1 Glycosyltransferase involved in cell wall bisynthesis [Salinimicrobium catena]SEE77609.1 Glycosyltransferase involved in cell wall bisynthesis [Salinimicrobium catena]
MPKIKVLHIIKSLGRGGAEMLLPETLQLHDREKYEFHYIYFLPWKDQMVSRIQEEGGKVTCFRAKDNIRLILQYKKVINYCREHGIELIHCHLPWAGFVGRLVHQKTGIPVLYTEHNMQERYHIATKTINKFTFNSQNLAIGVSDDVTNSIRKNIHPRIPVETVLNGVNTTSFVRKGNSEIRKEFSIPEDAIVIGNVAVFRFQKRLVEWLRVFEEIQKRNPKVYGIIVGAGPLEDEIKTELKRLKLEKKVFLPGLQTEVRPYFEAMDIFMMSSQFEGLPIALLEAMSMECAVVATDAGGIKEVIRNEKDGLTCPVENWQNLVDRCELLINDQHQLERYKSAARKRVVESFSLKKMVEELEEYYAVHTKTISTKNKSYPLSKV